VNTQVKLVYIEHSCEQAKLKGAILDIFNIIDLIENTLGSRYPNKTSVFLFGYRDPWDKKVPKIMKWLSSASKPAAVCAKISWKLGLERYFITLNRLFARKICRYGQTKTYNEQINKN
jgi:hypothetical protein